MLWWIVGIVAVWIVVGAVAATWIGRAVSHADARETAVERRREVRDMQPRDDVA